MSKVSEQSEHLLHFFWPPSGQKSVKNVVFALFRPFFEGKMLAKLTATSWNGRNVVTFGRLRSEEAF
jgi:hypothetical protein